MFRSLTTGFVSKIGHDVGWFSFGLPLKSHKKRYPKNREATRVGALQITQMSRFGKVGFVPFQVPSLANLGYLRKDSHMATFPLEHVLSRYSCVLLLTSLLLHVSCHTGLLLIYATKPD